MANLLLYSGNGSNMADGSNTKDKRLVNFSWIPWVDLPVWKPKRYLLEQMTST